MTEAMMLLVSLLSTHLRFPCLHTQYWRGGRAESEHKYVDLSETQPNADVMLALMELDAEFNARAQLYKRGLSDMLPFVLAALVAAPAWAHTKLSCVHYDAAKRVCNGYPMAYHVGRKSCAVAGSSTGR